MKALAAVTSLLLSTALLLIGQGMQLTLLPLRAAANGLTQGEVARFISIAILGGALFQYPIGWLSDRIDRPVLGLRTAGWALCRLPCRAGAVGP